MQRPQLKSATEAICLVYSKDVSLLKYQPKGGITQGRKITLQKTAKESLKKNKKPK